MWGLSPNTKKKREGKSVPTPGRGKKRSAANDWVEKFKQDPGTGTKVC